MTMMMIIHLWELARDGKSVNKKSNNRKLRKSKTKTKKSRKSKTKKNKNFSLYKEKI